MSESGRSSKSGVGWVAGLAVAVIVTSAGFALGIVAGVTWEEPGLVIGWLSGETDGIEWSVEGAPQVAEQQDPVPDVAAAPPLGAGVDRAEPEVVPERPKAVSASPVPAPAPAQRASAKPPAPESKPRPAPAPAADVAGRFAVQVGAFAERRAADGLAATLRGAGFPVYLSDSKSGARWRVRVGPHKTREAAERTAERLKGDRKLPTWVLSEDS